MDEKNIKKKCENTFNYLTPTKSTSLKRLPTHSYNNYLKNQKQTNLISKFKENSNVNNNSNNINNIKVNSNSSMPFQKFERKHSQLLPLIDKKNKNNMGINNEINAFRKQHRKSVEPKDPNTSSFQLNKNDSGNCEKKEDNKEELFDNNEEESKEITHLYKTKLSSCKQLRLKKFI